jgi:hypothetical protein
MDLHDVVLSEWSIEEVTPYIAEAEDVDEFRFGRTALWDTVFWNRPDRARLLVEAGADPHRPMMLGWSPARLAAAGPTPDLFGPPAELTDEETATVAEARRLRAVVNDYSWDGLGMACVAGIDVAEAARRLGAATCEKTEFDDAVMGATDVPGGVVLIQPWGYRPEQVDVHERLSVGTVCYGFYENPKSGPQGSISRDGRFTDNDLFPGGDPREDESAHEVLLAYVYRSDSIAYSCAYAGLRLTDSRAITGEPDVWLRVTETAVNWPYDGSGPRTAPPA